MADYSVSLAASAERELKKFSPSVVERIFPHLENLAIEPRPARSKKLTGGKDEWRIRIGSYRVIYTINDKLKIVEVTRIADRKDVYDR